MAKIVKQLAAQVSHYPPKRVARKYPGRIQGEVIQMFSKHGEGTR